MNTTLYRQQCEAFFEENAVSDVAVPLTEEYGDYISDINKERSLLVADVVTGNKTAAEAMAEYKNTVGSLVDIVLKSLNK